MQASGGRLPIQRARRAAATRTPSVERHGRVGAALPPVRPLLCVLDVLGQAQGGGPRTASGLLGSTRATQSRCTGARRAQPGPAIAQAYRAGGLGLRDDDAGGGGAGQSTSSGPASTAACWVERTARPPPPPLAPHPEWLDTPRRPGDGGDGGCAPEGQLVVVPHLTAGGHVPPPSAGPRASRSPPPPRATTGGRVLRCMHLCAGCGATRLAGASLPGGWPGDGGPVRFEDVWCGGAGA
jgi:hypothetical protein